MFESNAGRGEFRGLWNKLLSMFNTGKEEVVKSSKISKGRLDLSFLKKEREQAFERLGEEVYKRHRDKRTTTSGLDAFFAEIEIINLKLSSKERELKDLKGEVEIGQPASADSSFRSERGKGDSRPRKRYNRPRKDISEVSRKVEGTNNMGL